MKKFGVKNIIIVFLCLTIIFLCVGFALLSKELENVKQTLKENINWKLLIKNLAIPLLVGIVSGFLTKDANAEFTATAIQPTFTPPPWVFPVVWTILYTLMGGSYGILKSNNLADSQINFIYYLQLVVNVLWPIFFFIFKWRFFAFP